MLPFVRTLTALAFLVLTLGTGLTPSARAEQPGDDDAPALVRGSTDALRLPAGTAMKLGIRTAEAEPRAVLKPRVLQLTGSTALDPGQVARIRVRFTPFEVLTLGAGGLREGEPREQKEVRQPRPGDKVAKGEVLAVVRSDSVAQKKHDLFDAAVLLAMDEEILDRFEKVAGQAPEVFPLHARRTVVAGRQSVNRARAALKAWGIPESDIEAVEKEARGVAENPKADTDEARKTRSKDWAKVALKAPIDGIIIECNAAPGEVVKDDKVNLFQLANVDRLRILANVREEYLPALNALKAAERRWSIKTADTEAAVAGGIDEIGNLIDPTQHTAIVKGTIDNKNHQIRAGQFVTASVSLPFAPDEVSVPAAALVEVKGQTFVFVQPDSRKPIYEQRRVIVVRSGQDGAHLRTKLTPEEKRQGVQTIQIGERVVETGALVLRALLDDLKSE